MNKFLTMEDYKEIAQSKYTAYTVDRLDARYDMLTSIIHDPNSLDEEVIDAAIERKKVMKCIELFLQEEVDDPRATPALILNILFGEGAVNRLAKRTIGGEVAQDLLQKTGEALKGTTKVTKKGIHAFATWLLKKTKEEK